VILWRGENKQNGVVLTKPWQNNLESDIALDAHVGSINIGTINGHVDIGGPGIILPFHIKAFVGLEVGCQGAVLAKTTFPLDRNVALAIDGGRNAVVVVNLLRKCHFLAVHRSSELNVGLVIAVVDHNISRVVLKVEARSDSNARAIRIKALGGLDSPDAEVIASRSGKMNGKIYFLVGGVDIKVGMVALLSVHLGAGRNTVVNSGLRIRCEWIF